MTRRRSDIPLTKKTLFLGTGDFEAMGRLFPTLGASNAIRVLIRNFIRRTEASLSPVEIDLDPTELKELLDEHRDADA